MNDVIFLYTGPKRMSSASISYKCLFYLPQKYRRQLWGKDIFARKYTYEKLTKCPNFARKIVFPDFFGGGGAFVLPWPTILNAYA